jgi:hypothetical protein
MFRNEHLIAASILSKCKITLLAAVATNKQGLKRVKFSPCSPSCNPVEVKFSPANGYLSILGHWSLTSDDGGKRKISAITPEARGKVGRGGQ